MTHFLLRVLRFAVFAVSLFVFLHSTQAAGLSGRIVGVVDGDTVDLLTESKQLVRVRLAGIDAPERGQPHGTIAKKVLSDLVFSKSASLDGEKKDRYGRVVAKVVVEGLDANLQMVRLGYAWHYTKYEREQSAKDRSLYNAAQGIARQERLGLWKDSNPVAPWDFRASRRGNSKN